MITLASGLASTAPVLPDTLPSLTDGAAPQTVDALWAGFDPRAEPLDVEVLKEWEQDGVKLQVLRYRIGVFKGQKSMMAAVYGYPKDGRNLPGLVQIHGGGQYADWNACLTNAKRGYATISLSWGGRISAPDYHVNPGVVKLFWEGKTDHEHYKLTTDWGALDAYHAPNRHPGNSNWSNLKPADWTLDSVDSPRNSNWFLCTLAARRALTFLEQQPQVDGQRLGAYGHSMGGKLAVLLAGIDDRVKAAAPSCGGVSDRKEDPLMRDTISDDVYLKRITCPIVFLKPANDFHGRIEDLQTAVKEIQSRDWRVICAAHHQHQDNAESEVATQLWFDQYLKDTFAWPATPRTKLALASEDGLPELTVFPDHAREILAVDVFYTQQGRDQNAADRFWHFAKPVKNGKAWTAKLPVHGTDQPLWVYANVMYRLDKPVSGAGYYYRTYTTDRFNVSSMMDMIEPAELKAAGVKPSLEPSLIIESFGDDWEKEWFTYRPEDWARTTRKINDPCWAAPANARLSLEVRTDNPNKLVVGLDGYAAETAVAGGADWQTVILAADAFHDADGQVLTGWNDIKELRLGSKETLRSKKEGVKPVQLGGDWQGDPPAFRNLRWVPQP